MFRLNPNPTFKAQVALSIPGQATPLEITVEFRHKTATALQDWRSRAKGRTDVDNVAEIIAGWDGVFADDGTPVPYSATALATLLDNYSAAKWELVAAYHAELTEAKQKN